MKRGTGAVRALLLFVLATTALLVAESPASAAESGPGCGDGVLEDSQGCYTLVDATASCPAGATLTEGQCRLPVDRQPGPLVCPDGSALVGGDCVRSVDPTVTRTCTEGTLTGNQCVVVGTPPERGPSTCPVSATVFEDGAECYRLVDKLAQPGTCPPGSTEDSSGRCRVSVADALGELQCGTGFLLVADTCTRSVPPVDVPTCTEGTLTGGRCIIIGPPPTAGPDVCPVSATVFEDGPECYSLVDKTTGTVCPPGTTDDPGGRCRQPIAAAPGLLTCDATFTLDVDRCIRQVMAFQAMTCPEGTPTDGGCRVIGDPPVLGPATCPAGALGVPDDCYVVVAPIQIPDQPTPQCPAGTTDVGGECRQPVASIPGMLECADGFDEPFNGECTRFTDQVPTLICIEGVLENTVCVITGPAPTEGPPTCPVGTTAVQGGPGCYRLIDRIATELCPVGTTDDIGGRCRQPVNRQPGTPRCTPEFMLDAGNCVREANPIQVPTCTEGTLTNGECVIVGPAPVMGPSTCPVGAVGAPGNCYTIVPKDTPAAVCPNGTTNDTSTNRCRQPVARVQGALACAAGYTLAGDTCTRTVDPTVTQTCSEGTLTEGRCVITVAAVAGPAVCPVPGSASDCFSASDPDRVCPSGSVPTADPTKCRIDLARPTIVSPVQQLPSTGIGMTTGIVSTALSLTTIGIAMLLVVRGTVDVERTARNRTRRRLAR